MGAVVQEDDGEPFEAKMQRMMAKLNEQNARVGAAGEGDPGQSERVGVSIMIKLISGNERGT